MATSEFGIPATFEDHGKHFYPEFPEILGLCKELASTIDDDCRQTGKRFDRIVSVPRGGLYVAMILSQAFKMSAPELINVSLTSYGGHSADSRSDFKFGQWPTDEEIEGLRLLVPDDVFDTGNTQDRIHDRFYEQGAEEVVSAAIYAKLGNSDGIKARPKYCMRIIPGQTWVHFPWEPIEGLIPDPCVYSGIGYTSVNGLVTVERQ